MNDISLADDYSADIQKVKDEISEIDHDADGAPALYSSLHAELARLRKLQAEAKPAKVEPRHDGKTIGEVWQSLDTTGKRRWLLSRRGSEWLPNQTTAKVTVHPRNEDGYWHAVIDLGQYTDMVASLQIL